jgi:hypothetical protein
VVTEIWPLSAAVDLEPVLAAARRVAGFAWDRNGMLLVRDAVFELRAGGPLDEILLREGRGRRRGKTTLACLMPGSRTRGLHRDMGDAPYDDGACPRRWHVPLQTNDGAVFHALGADWRMPIGRAYLINPLTPHAVVNRGDGPRVHLFFNALELDT